MSAELLAFEAQRERWRRHRGHEHLAHGFSDDFALGGLGRHVDELCVRVVLLPTDPGQAIVPLDSETLDWLKADRAAPYGGSGPRWGSRARATSDAIVRFDQYQVDRGWNRFLALHRHGGLEFALGNMATLNDGLRVFPLRQIVGHAWALLALHQEAATRWPILSPLELSIGLRNTAGATLGMLAEGWSEPGVGLWDPPTCIEEQVLLRWELDDVDPQRVAIDVGDRIENAFGSVHRRHLAHRGEYEGRFDPRFAG